MNSFNWSEKSKAEWNNRANFWSGRSKDMWENGSRKDIIPFFNRHLHKNSKILDVGCGDGYGTYLLHSLGHYMVGVDISDEMITKAKERLEEVPFEVADIGELPFGKESMDAVLSINVLEWVEVPALALEELKRVLKTNGLFCAGILGPTAGPRMNGYRKVYGEKTISNSMMPWEFSQLAKELGFEVVDGFGVYKDGVTEKNYQGLPTQLKQALSFMWVFLLRKVGEKDG
ncbi:class I SAM-dependent methyltransferase [Ornithinibacillus californiensis]|uniref:class I SAM-dependent methyltransferase n=1 Tax=Ornithinibacillus californiensis TaxID=161536 RepID=UPI00064E04EA|nr:class I SAM-dependent methyltransferase [Ornithinibacillus californiensis]